MSRAAALAGLSGLLALAACGPDPAAQQRMVRELVFEKLSYGDRPVVVGPAVLQNNFAMVDWTRGAFAGGRALARRHGPQWKIIACGGAPLKGPDGMVKAGAPIAVARPLTTKLLHEEERLPPERQNQIDKWQGLGPAAAACPVVLAD